MYLYIYIYIYIYIYVDVFIYSDSNADIFLHIFFSQNFWNLKITENLCDHAVEY